MPLTTESSGPSLQENNGKGKDLLGESTRNSTNRLLEEGKTLKGIFSRIFLQNILGVELESFKRSVIDDDYLGLLLLDILQKIDLSPENIKLVDDLFNRDGYIGKDKFCTYILPYFQKSSLDFNDSKYDITSIDIIELSGLVLSGKLNKERLNEIFDFFFEKFKNDIPSLNENTYFSKGLYYIKLLSLLISTGEIENGEARFSEILGLYNAKKNELLPSIRSSLLEKKYADKDIERILTRENNTINVFTSPALITLGKSSKADFEEALEVIISDGLNEYIDFHLFTWLKLFFKIGMKAGYLDDKRINELFAEIFDREDYSPKKVLLRTLAETGVMDEAFINNKFEKLFAERKPFSSDDKLILLINTGKVKKDKVKKVLDSQNIPSTRDISRGDHKLFVALLGNSDFDISGEEDFREKYKENFVVLEEIELALKDYYIYSISYIKGIFQNIDKLEEFADFIGHLQPNSKFFKNLGFFLENNLEEINKKGLLYAYFKYKVGNFDFNDDLQIIDDDGQVIDNYPINLDNVTEFMDDDDVLFEFDGDKGTDISPKLWSKAWLLKSPERILLIKNKYNRLHLEKLGTLMTICINNGTNLMTDEEISHLKRQTPVLPLQKYLFVYQDFGGYDSKYIKKNVPSIGSNTLNELINGLISTKHNGLRDVMQNMVGNLLSEFTNGLPRHSENGENINQLPIIISLHPHDIDTNSSLNYYPEISRFVFEFIKKYIETGYSKHIGEIYLNYSEGHRAIEPIPKELCDNLLVYTCNILEIERDRKWIRGICLDLTSKQKTYFSHKKSPCIRPDDKYDTRGNELNNKIPLGFDLGNDSLSGCKTKEQEMSLKEVLKEVFKALQELEARIDQNPEILE